MFKKRARPQASRKADSDEEEGGDTKIILADKKKRADNLVSSSSKKSDAEAQERLNEDIVFTGIKTNNEVITDLGEKSGIFAVNEIDSAHDQDHRAILERNQQISDQIKSGELKEGVYRGMGAYKQVLSRQEGAIAASKYTGTLGPIRGSSTNVKMNIRFDYWGTSGDGGVCKDYKMTGYCGYGDTCLYMHDRSDYKSGWQIDREFEEKEKAKAAKLARRLQRRRDDPDCEFSGSDGEVSDEVSDDEGAMPGDCQICRKDWPDCETDPVVTQCKHFFCETCALENYQESQKCAVCGVNTSGIFNNAGDQLEKRFQKRENKILARREVKKPDFSKNMPYSCDTS